MEKIPCDVIKDLMPSVADGIASEETVKAVNEHTAECEECRRTLEAMLAGEEKGSESDKKELDFLKKNRKRNKRIAVVCILAAVIAVFLAALIKLLVIGSADASGVSYIAAVDGKRLTSSAAAVGSARCIKKLEYREKDGVVYVTPRTVVSRLFGRNELTEEYTAKEDIKKVVFNNVIAYDASTMGREFSDELKARIIADWERWNSLSEEDRMFSSVMPGSGQLFFVTWEEAVGFVGFDVANPFEEDLVFEKMNFAGTEKTGVYDPADKNLYHANVEWLGKEDGSVTFAEITAGYRVRTFDLDTVSGDQPRIRLIYTVSLARDGHEEESGSERLELEDGQVVYIRRSSGEHFTAVDIVYTLEGFNCTVRIIGGPNDAEELETITTGVLNAVFGNDRAHTSENQ